MNDCLASVDEIYFDWLEDKVRCWAEVDASTDESYHFLLRRLYQKEYTAVMEEDKKLLKYAQELRNMFVLDRDYVDMDIVTYSRPARVLEVLIRLCQYGEDLTIGNTKCIDTRRLFWELMKNLKLDLFSDYDFFNHGDTWDKIDTVLDKWMSRSYKRNGEGNIFLVEDKIHRKKDMRKVETWYQMQYYLVENYPA